ncbi:CCR4-NOT transcription complex subunit 2 [Trichinella pseudospiralis]|uniref:CCR4-NOT transcription complex subunit 2 n=1 Tax=Trichinella pseudospiralis TaxID=6337 RepID=A0A0V1IZB9_TRIPS|nr:CCR4-NOT transcription complex subunit 2 [Trichinella pseudospiralis]KRZ21646.1 CCR4-NOT transcription complex subunit 2 [Trichinella pseudospiralis]KRZ27605.1 CCR4-NOT transcription complex subunit 2 [Trichinella pseudospiralis]
MNSSPSENCEPSSEVVPSDNRNISTESDVENEMDDSLAIHQFDFQIYEEDFPALPSVTDSNLNEEEKDCHKLDSSQTEARPVGSPAEDNFQGDQTFSKKINNDYGCPSVERTDLNVSADTSQSNRGQYDMKTLATFLKSLRKADPFLKNLFLGYDVTKLDANVTFENGTLRFLPIAPLSCRDGDIKIPSEYLISSRVNHRLPSINMGRYNEDLLFYIFYNFLGDCLQLSAAAELFRRNWRYHLYMERWLFPVSTVFSVSGPERKEHGACLIFDPLEWRKIQKSMHLIHLNEETQLQTLVMDDQ